MGGPLSGLKVLDFTRLLPGPFGTMVLSDLGAEVVKVEAPNLPDLMLFMPPPDGNTGAPHRMINRGKRSISLDLKKPEGVEVVKKLVPGFDVVIEQFRPSVMERLGCGYDCLRELNPGLVYCSITGYGQSGPYRDRAGHDINYLSLSGVMSFTGKKETGPVLPGIQIADQCAGGMNAVTAILAALYHREKTGEGQYIDISMTDGVIHLGAIYATGCLAGGGDLGREEHALNGGGVYDFYETKDGGHMSVGSLEPQFFAALLKAIGREDLAADTLSPQSGKKAKEAIREEFRKKTRAEWEEIFKETDACVEPVLSLSEMIEHENTRGREMVVEVERPDGTRMKQIAAPFKFSGTPCEYGRAGAVPGSDTDEILKEFDFSLEEIDKLRQEKVIK